VRIRDRVAQLVPIQFRYERDLDPLQRLRGGFSAQQVATIFPDAVFEEDGVLKIDGGKLAGYINQALNEE
tara:strand:- start:218 stop:427 length:210 start_codon:yes stop_codon:yes gene_type:complete